MTNNNTTLHFRPEALAMIASLLTALYTSNALGSYHERQVGGTFGAIRKAIIAAIWCEVRVSNNRLTADEITAIAERLFDEEMDNMEHDIAYQIRLWNEGIIDLH